MKKTFTETVIRKESVEHYYCNKCGEEIALPPHSLDNEQGILINLIFEQEYVNFHLCRKCIEELLASLKISADRISRLER
jgi:hypothetical protein